MKKEATLASLIQTSKDGEWGKGEPFNGSVEMAVVRGTDFNDISLGNISNLPIRYIPQRIAERKTLQANDIIFETAGGSKNSPTGRSVFIKLSILHQLELPLTCASFSRFIRIDPAKANPGYVYWYLQYLYESGELQKYHKQHTGVARFQYTDFSTNEALIFPSDISIQNKIANILFGYEDLIENNTRQIKILEEMAQLIYREWFVNFRFPGHEQVKMVDSQLGCIPEGWEVQELGKIAQEMRRSVEPDQVDPNTPYFGLEHLPRKSIALSTWGTASQVQSTKLVFKKGEILFGKIRPYLHKVGVAPIDGVCSSDAIVITAIDSKNFPFVLACISTEEFINYATQTSQGTKMPRANWKVLIKYPIAVPPPLLLNRFNELMQSIIDQIQIIIFENKNITITRDLLLPKLISREIDLETLNTPEIKQWAA